MTSTSQLSALLGSRICHDLISPLGAIGNGVELLEMSGTAPGPEMALISESVRSANARIRFFRVAFGAAAPGQMLPRSEIREVLEGIAIGARSRVDWQADADLPRIEVKLAFLLIMCLETAMPRGGTITVAADGSGWRLTTSAERLRDLPELWSLLTTPDPATLPAAGDVHFLLAQLCAQDAGLRLMPQIGADSIRLEFGPA